MRGEGQLGVLLLLPTGAEGLEWFDTNPHHAVARLAALCGCLFDGFFARLSGASSGS